MEVRPTEGPTCLDRGSQLLVLLSSVADTELVDFYVPAGGPFDLFSCMINHFELESSRVPSISTHSVTTEKAQPTQRCTLHAPMCRSAYLPLVAWLESD